MRNPDFLQRLRARSLPGNRAESGRPFRLWMTGSLAVVMAALAPGRVLAEETQSSQRWLRHSHYNVAEAVMRIEAAVRGQGLSVLARVGQDTPILVLASSVGGTPVVMDASNSRIDIPLSVRLRRVDGGGVDVSIAAACAPLDALWSELPRAVADDLAALPDLLDRALA
ncbi:hypothetical protein BH11PSE9_BH11PSE9_14790 [soil metagenome]